jgi:hypothetical protein
MELVAAHGIGDKDLFNWGDLPQSQVCDAFFAIEECHQLHEFTSKGSNK